MIPNGEILAPAAVLVGWSLVVLAWTVATRLPAFSNAGIDLTTAPPGGRFSDVEPQLPDKVRWVAHNYNHLMEQPTIFYATVVILALAATPGTGVIWAWGYTGLRVVHSLWQGLVNTVPVRFVIFALSTLCLAVLAYQALRATLG